jgi:prophage maintenance system killer protein
MGVRVDPAATRTIAARRWIEDGLVGFARSQRFHDGNKRTALACALVFLRWNGYVLHMPGKELYALIMQTATGKADDEIAAGDLRSRMEAGPGR